MNDMKMEQENHCDNKIWYIYISLAMYSSYETMICSTSRELSTICTLVCFLFWYGLISPICIDLTHWGRATHICVGKLTTIGSDNGLSPGRRQAIIWTNAGILLIGPLGTNVSEILIGIKPFSFKQMHLKMSSAKWRPFVSASMS